MVRQIEFTRLWASNSAGPKKPKKVEVATVLQRWGLACGSPPRDFQGLVEQLLGYCTMHRVYGCHLHSAHQHGEASEILLLIFQAQSPVLRYSDYIQLHAIFCFSQ